MTKGDVLVLIALVLSSGLVLRNNWPLFGQAATVEIWSKNAQKQIVSLSDERIIEVMGVLGKSEIQIKDGKIRFLSSPCRRQVCVYQGWIDRSGALIACIPNGVSVMLQNSSTEFDSINF